MTVSTVPTLKQVPLWPIQWPQQGQPWQNRELLQQLAIETPSSCCGWIWSGIPRVPPRGSRVTRGIAFAGYLALWLGTAPCLPWLRHCESIASTPQPSPLAPTGGDALKCCDWCAQLQQLTVSKHLMNNFVLFVYCLIPSTYHEGIPTILCSCAWHSEIGDEHFYAVSKMHSLSPKQNITGYIHNGPHPVVGIQGLNKFQNKEIPSRE